MIGREGGDVPMLGRLKSRLRRHLPNPTMTPRQYLACACADAISTLNGSRNVELPPSRWLFDGSQSLEDFVNDGQEFFGYFIDHVGLESGHRVFEVGSGNGRMAMPLAKFLDATGSYDGLDIVNLGVKWCQKHLTPRYPHFNFHHADIYNGLYNSNSEVDAAQYKFPFADSSFDLVFATSVFTHTLPDVFENYVCETARVLAPGGRLLASLFLINEDSQSLIEAGRSKHTFSHDMGTFRAESDRVLEGAVALPEAYVRDTLARQGLRVGDSIHSGSWCGRERYLSVQDIVIATKSNP